MTALRERLSFGIEPDSPASQRNLANKAAFEILLQTCSFSFMNRLTDGLRLPSEDEAIRVYRETYGGDFK
ncbi:MAG TPA: hypothetical protein VM656_03935 [Pyrinomonadaceae bacterium]|nr:hypothetical protein [Pyrinomonadaceae bacterium]